MVGSASGLEDAKRLDAHKAYGSQADFTNNLSALQNRSLVNSSVDVNAMNAAAGKRLPMQRG